METLIPSNEDERADAPASLDILDTPPEESFNRVIRIAAQIVGTPIDQVTLVDRARQWFEPSISPDVPGAPRAPGSRRMET